MLNILTPPRTQGYALTLDYPHRTEWFDQMFIIWYQPGAMFSSYKVVKARDLRLRFRECVNHSRAMYNTRIHQPDVTGNSDETQLPLYYQAFYHYFAHIKTNPVARTRHRGQQQRLEVVN